MSEETRLPELTSFLDWFKTRDEFETFIREFEELQAYMERNQAGRAIRGMLQVRMAHAKAVAGSNGGGRTPGGVVRPEDLYTINYLNGLSDGRIEELEALMSPGFGLKGIILDNADALEARWRAHEESLKAVEPQIEKEGGE